MKRLALILSLSMLFLAGFIPTKGASNILGQQDSLPIRPAVLFATDAQKQFQIYGNAKAADSLLRRAIAEDSTYAPAYYTLAQMKSSQRADVDSVIYYAQKAYLLDSLNKWYSELYAQSLAIGGRYHLARELYSKAIEREPQDLTSYIMVAMLYRQTSEPLSALSVLDSAEMRLGKSSYLGALRRELLLSTGQHERAIAEAQELIELDPQDIENRLALADLYSATQQDSLARREYDAVLQIDSSSVELLNVVAQYYLESGNNFQYFETLKLLMQSPQESLDNKIGTWSRITADNRFYARNLYLVNELAVLLNQLYPTEQRVVELYAQHLIASGSLDKALTLYKLRAKEDTPPVYDYYTSIIDIESYLQNVDSVELYANRAIALFPERHEIKLSLSNLYSYTKRYDEAINSYKELLPELPSDSLKGSVWGAIGDCYYYLSEQQKEGSGKAKSYMRKAYKAFDSSLKFFLNNPMVLNNYAYFLSLEGRDLQRALDMSGRAIALESGNPTYLDTYAWILFCLGRAEEAKSTMRQVIALDTTQSADIQFHYAEILAALGETFMAEIYYDKALKLGYDESIIDQRKALLK